MSNSTKSFLIATTMFLIAALVEGINIAFLSSTLPFHIIALGLGAAGSGFFLKAMAEKAIEIFPA